MGVHQHHPCFDPRGRLVQGSLPGSFTAQLSWLMTWSSLTAASVTDGLLQPSALTDVESEPERDMLTRGSSTSFAFGYQTRRPSERTSVVFSSAISSTWHTDTRHKVLLERGGLRSWLLSRAAYYAGRFVEFSTVYFFGRAGQGDVEALRMCVCCRRVELDTPVTGHHHV